jgi:cytochrome c oxidase assembly factor CtaG
MAALDLFVTMMAMSMLGALLTLSPHLWHPSYSASVPGVSPLEDQQLAGLVMRFRDARFTQLRLLRS